MNDTCIVIATADRTDVVDTCLGCLAQQLSAGVAVVVVDAGRERPVSEESLRKLWPNVSVVRSAVRNAGSQRNLGALAAKVDIIVFIDDDVILQPGWWPAIIKPLLDQGDESCVERDEQGAKILPGPAPGRPHQESRTKNQEPGATNIGHPSPITHHPLPVGAVAGAVWCNPAPKFTDRRGGYVNWLGYPVQITHRSERAPRDVDWPMTTNMAVRRDVFLAVGGFAEVYGIYDEDVDFGLKLRNGGWGIRFAPAAAVYHYYRKRQPQPMTKQKQFMLGRNRAVLLVRNYGVLSRVWLQVLAGSVAHAGRAVWMILRSSQTAIGHAAAYMAGMVWGLWVGWRHPVERDGDELGRE